MACLNVTGTFSLEVGAVSRRTALPDHVRLAARLFVVRLAAPKCADFQGVYVRVREPGGRDCSGLADSQRIDNPVDTFGRWNHCRLGCSRDPRGVTEGQDVGPDRAHEGAESSSLLAQRRLRAPPLSGGYGLVVLSVNVSVFE